MMVAVDVYDHRFHMLMVNVVLFDRGFDDVKVLLDILCHRLLIVLDPSGASFWLVGLSIAGHVNRRQLNTFQYVLNAAVIVIVVIGLIALFLLLLLLLRLRLRLLLRLLLIKLNLLLLLLLWLLIEAASAAHCSLLLLLIVIEID